MSGPMMDARATRQSELTILMERVHTKDNAKQTHVLSTVVKRGNFGLIISIALSSQTGFITYNDQHASAENPRTSNSTDCSSQNQDPHTRCYSADQRSELEDEHSEEDDML